MKTHYFLLFGFLMMSDFRTFAAEPKLSISWAYGYSKLALNLPKDIIVNEDHPLIRLFKSELSEYNHTSFEESISRIELELKTKPNVCFAGSSEATRRREFAYLTPEYIQPAPVLVLKKAVADRLLSEGKQQVQLKQILNDKSLRGVLGSARSFGKEIDQLLSENGSNVSRKSFETFSPNIFHMIENNHADYTFEYPYLIRFYQSQKMISEDLVSLQIKDVQPFITQYLACSKTPAGLAIVGKVDAIIRDQIKNPVFWKSILESIPNQDRSQFQKEINKFISERTVRPIIIK